MQHYEICKLSNKSAVPKFVTKKLIEKMIYQKANVVKIRT